MANGLPVLWHLKVSHYNEKARWALDYKGLPHTRRAMDPGRHQKVAKKLSGGTTFPVLELNGRAVGDSTEIIAELERLRPKPELYPADPAERRRALELGVRLVTRGEALAALVERSRTMVVAGTHGKTTTTSMIVSILRSTGEDPTYLVGGGLNDVGTNARSGTSDLAVAESDESDGSFLLLRPHVAVVTNVEADHLDHWGSFDAVRDAFARFIGHVDPTGGVTVPATDPALVAAASATGARVVTFGLEDGDVRATEVDPAVGGARFFIELGGERAEVLLRVPGVHNVTNALGAAAACSLVGIGLQDIATGLGEFHGVERRFQIRGAARGVTVVDDYAHHPTEVRATLEAARPGPWERVVAVFQPHRYTRTAAMHREFGPAFAEADRVVVTDVYGAGEDPVPGVTGKLVADAVCEHLPGRPVAYLPHRAELLSYLQSSARVGDALFTLGAGDISTVGDELLSRLGKS
jgi:UDP-N-acetylmuramate--alanine ligase